MERADREARTVLVVEDSRTQRDALCSLLEGAGYSVLGAVDGEDGLAKAHAHPVDLVISDVIMPGMDGYALCRALRADDRLRNLPVVLLTSLSDPRDVIRALEAGASHFVRKPYGSEYLLGRVRNILATEDLRGRRAAEPLQTIRHRGIEYQLDLGRLDLLGDLLAMHHAAEYEIIGGPIGSGAGASVLVVEDSTTKALEMRCVLEGAGYGVRVASTGVDGLEALRASPVDLVIFDVMTPDMDGAAFCQTIRADPGHGELPILLVTATAEPHDVIAGLAAGASHFIRAPFGEAHLRTRVRNLVAGRGRDGSASEAERFEFVFEHVQYSITAGRVQVLDLLLSSYDDAVTKSCELAQARDDLRALNEELERRVASRTVALSQEVEGHLQTERRLRASHEVLATTLDNMLDCCGRYSAIRDGAGRIVEFRVEEVNQAACTATRMPREQQIGKGLCEIQPGHRTSGLFDRFVALVESGEAIDLPSVPFQTTLEGKPHSRVLEVRANRLGDGFVAAWRDVTERRRVERRLEQAHDRTLALAGLFQSRPASEDDVAAQAVEVLVRITGSAFGYVAFVDAEQSTVSGHVWSERTRAACPLGVGPTIQHVCSEGILTEVVRQRRPVVENHLSSALRSRHLPEGHLPLQRFLGVPVIREGRVVLVAGLADKVEPYGDTDAGEAASYLAGVWEYIFQLRQTRARQESEERLREAQTMGRIGSWTYQVADGRLDWSDMVYTIHGRDHGLPPPTRTEEVAYYPGEDGCGLIELAEACAQRRRPFEMDIPVRREDGALVDVAVLGRPIIDGDRVVAVRGTVQDITARKRAEEAQRTSEDRHGVFLRAAVDGFLLADAHGWFQEVNDAYCRMCGYTGPELLKMNIADLEVAGSTRQMATRLRRVMADGSDRFESRQRRKDGSVFDVEVSAQYWPVDGGRLVAFVRDVTERKIAEQALRERTLALGERVKEIHCVISVSRVVNDPTLSAPEACRLAVPLIPPAWQYPAIARARITLLGQTFASPDFLVTPWRVSAEILVSNRVAGVLEVCYLIEPPGCEAEPFLSEERVLIRELARQLGMMVERLDADAAREHLEEQLRTTQKMEAIGILAGGVAHDFNNLISVIITYAGFAASALPEGDPIREDLQEVTNAGQRAAGLTRQLLAFGGKQVTRRGALNINEVVVGIEKMLRRILREDIGLQVRPAPDLAVVHADPGQIEQILMNLVVNSRDAMPNGGMITVETRNVRVGRELAGSPVALNPGPYVMLVVSDTGGGMDAGTRARIFEPFFTTKGVGKGTGLGLSTVYGIVKQGQGEITVDSELGVGTSVKVYFPAESPSSGLPTAEPRPVAAPKAGSGETVLVVEDEAAIREIVRRALAAHGYTVVTALDGEDALRVAVQHQGAIGLLLTDMVMPRLGGRALARQLLRARPALKVLYMSGYSDDDAVSPGLIEAGAWFISKPFTMDELIRQVDDIFEPSTPPPGPSPLPADDALPCAPALDAGALLVVPASVMDRLRSALTAARLDEFSEIADGLRATEPRIAAGLRLLAESYDYPGLRALLLPEPTKDGSHAR